MENTNQFEIIKTYEVLNKNKQKECRKVLRPLLKRKGVISMYLDNEYLFVEFNPRILNIDDIITLLEKAGFPVNHKIKYAS